MIVDIYLWMYLWAIPSKLMNTFWKLQTNNFQMSELPVQKQLMTADHMLRTDEIANKIPPKTVNKLADRSNGHWAQVFEIPSAASQTTATNLRAVMISCPAGLFHPFKQ